MCRPPMGSACGGDILGQMKVGPLSMLSGPTFLFLRDQAAWAETQHQEQDQTHSEEAHMGRILHQVAAQEAAFL